LAVPPAGTRTRLLNRLASERGWWMPMPGRCPPRWLTSTETYIPRTEEAGVQIPSPLTEKPLW